MRCKRHTVDFSSNNGVCASCLRERLLSLAASAAATAAVEDNLRQSHKSSNPQFLIFPRSVSPYVTRRKSDAGGADPLTSNRRFFTTPQVDLGYSCKDFDSNRSSKSKGGKISRISNLFRARSEDFDSNPKSNPRSSCDVSESSSSSSWSWMSSILSTGRSKRQPTTACYIEDVIPGRRPQRVFCRGMSPARDTELEYKNEPPSESIEETPGRSRRTPATKTPGRRKIANGIGKSMSGMGFCLSPLVRASPNCPFKRKIRFPSEFVGNAGEITAPEKPHISAAASFCANRSKKLVDLGRVNPRR
ncbi:hypothetical protein EUTSA_v10006502mg [Eutrema salsugineum]|uniref:Uncharacterized protein n=1 Tax=Eutrema salsugineum TaxID=72664 RepID=V4LNN5_EUTSA|nr:uncharacterized protein LOC18020099 [Eutrema salsugineum]ESQ44062.1 hypothetical protein EUTSA_v10006502mg [Eutrema salsugineum]